MLLACEETDLCGFLFEQQQRGRVGCHRDPPPKGAAVRAGVQQGAKGAKLCSSCEIRGTAHVLE